MELDNTTKENIEKMIGENDVFLFMKGNLIFLCVVFPLWPARF